MDCICAALFWTNCVFEHTYSRLLHADSGIYAVIEYVYYSIYAMVLHSRLHICYVCKLYDGIYAVIYFNLRWIPALLVHIC